DAAPLEVRVQPAHVSGERCALDRELQVTETHREQLLVGEAGPAPRRCARRDSRPASRGHSSEGRMAWRETQQRAYPSARTVSAVRSTGFARRIVAVDRKRVAFWRSPAQPPTSSSACARRRSAVLSINCFLIRLL